MSSNLHLSLVQAHVCVHTTEERLPAGDSTISAVTKWRDHSLALKWSHACFLSLQSGCSDLFPFKPFFRVFLHFLKKPTHLKISGCNELLLLLLLVCGSWLARDMFYNLITHTKSMNHSSTDSQRLGSAKNMLCINHWRKSKSFWFCFIKLFRIHSAVNLNHKVSFL